MNFYILICFIVTASCATVGEFPFHELAGSTTESVTELTTFDDSHTEESESIAPQISIDSERQAEQLASSQGPPSPFLQVIRDFLFQARDGLLDPDGVVLRSVAEGHVEETSEKVVKAFQRGVIEATTLLVSHVEDFVVSTMPTVSNTSFVQVDFLKRAGEAFPEEPVLKRIDADTPIDNNKRKLQVANLSISCSNCYDTLQSCVQQCFEKNNCNDIERNVRSCPPVPNRLCNPFTPWSPVNECQSNQDCKSPLLCCNDGCIDKCTVGVWNP